MPPSGSTSRWRRRNWKIDGMSLWGKKRPTGLEDREQAVQPRTVKELTAKNVESIQRLEAAAGVHRGRMELFADSARRRSASAAISSPC